MATDLETLERAQLEYAQRAGRGPVRSRQHFEACVQVENDSQEEGRAREGDRNVPRGGDGGVRELIRRAPWLPSCPHLDALALQTSDLLG